MYSGSLGKRAPAVWHSRHWGSFPHGPHEQLPAVDPAVPGPVAAGPRSCVWQTGVSWAVDPGMACTTLARQGFGLGLILSLARAHGMQQDPDCAISLVPSHANRRLQLGCAQPPPHTATCLWLLSWAHCPRHHLGPLLYLVSGVDTA